jgi:hypothetical protein
LQAFISKINQFELSSDLSTILPTTQQDLVLTQYFTETCDFLLKLHHSVPPERAQTSGDIGSSLYAYLHLMLSRQSDALVNAWTAAKALLVESKRLCDLSGGSDRAFSSTTSALVELASSWRRKWNLRQVSILNGTCNFFFEFVSLASFDCLVADLQVRPLPM